MTLNCAGRDKSTITFVHICFPCLPCISTTLSKMANERLRTALSVFLLVVFVVTTQAAAKDPIVTISGGKVQGTILQSIKGKEFYAFRGLPYAEPPVGDLRFKGPLPKSPWKDEIIDATKDGPACTQPDITKNEVHGQEDCLWINVYTRELPGVEKTDDDKSDVMVYIFGGAYILGEGGSSLYSPVILMDSDIVFVTLNYRVGAFGFLSTGDEASPGNYGMLDQTLALKWVQENIERFGGNPNKVTIFGESAGASSVSQHILSPLSKGLFHGVIAMSGAASCYWADNDDVSYWSQRLAKDLNCPTDDNQRLVDCLRKIPAEDIVKATQTYSKASFCPLPFTPSVDGHFMPDHPLKLMGSVENLNRVPVISGIIKTEGAFFINHILLGRPASSVLTPEHLTTIIENSFTTHRPLEEVTKLVKEEYFSDVDLSNITQVEDALVDAYSDGLFHKCHFETISMMAKAGLECYAYHYEHNGTFTFAHLLGTKLDRRWGAAHGDDLFVIFPFPGNMPAEKDQNVSNTMVKIWTNFAKYGKPIPEDDSSMPKWPPVKGGEFPEYHINDEIRVETYNIANDPKYKFWTKDIRKAREEGTMRVKKEEL